MRPPSLFGIPHLSPFQHHFGDPLLPWQRSVRRELLLQLVMLLHGNLAWYLFLLRQEAWTVRLVYFSKVESHQEFENTTKNFSWYILNIEFPLSHLISCRSRCRNTVEEIPCHLGRRPTNTFSEVWKPEQLHLSRCHRVPLQQRPEYLFQLRISRLYPQSQRLRGLAARIQ